MSDFPSAVLSMLSGRRSFNDGEIILIGVTALACWIILVTLIRADRRQDGLRE
jgi:hypothetical protein